MKALFTLIVSITLVVCLAFDANCASKKKATSGPPLAITSPAFAAGTSIPKIYTCSGSNYSPALQWANAPEGTKSFAIIVDDQDAPLDTFTHWIIVNIPATQTSLAEKASPKGALPAGSLEGTNGFGKIGYGGPCPPSGNPHRYYFKLYALRSMLKVQPGITKNELILAMKGHILAEAQMFGIFEK
jgi:Raf kinase inhibitor-like YbhB/YbcL family protein